jgi:phosphoglycerate kinase
MIAVVGGAKVSTKIDLLKELIKKAQTIVVAGGMANSFLYALGHNIGKSLCEKDLRDNALEILQLAKKHNCQFILPIDVVVAKNFTENASHRTIDIKDVEDDDIILDLGLQTSKLLAEKLAEHKTILWNGPLGAFELKPFNQGTVAFANEVAKLTILNKLLSIAGGGDVVSAINSCNLFDKFTYISTAGGAFLEWLEGKKLPGILALEKCAK